MKHLASSVPALLLITGLLEFCSIVNSQCDGVCVPLAKCNNTFGGAPVVYIRTSIASDCDHYLEVCCDEEEVIANSRDAASVTNGIAVTAPSPDFDECGYTNSKGVILRTADAHNETEFGEFPWMVAILEIEILLDRETFKYVCGGSLIDSNLILTAAHCVNNKDSARLLVRAGEWDTRSDYEILPHQDRRVKSVIINHGYNSNVLFNDVALLVLENPFRASQHVQLICLPPQGMTFSNEDCVVAGWGKAHFNSESYQNIMKKIQIPMVSHKNCENALRKTRLGSRFKLHNSFVCAGGEEGIDSCQGDGGSPLICPFPETAGRYYQAGIVSWGIECGLSGIPGVYTKTSLYTGWINDQSLLNSD